MAIIESTLSGAEAIAEALEARDDIVIKEQQTEPGVFIAAHGPFGVWERRVEPAGDLDDPGPTAVQRVTYRVAAPLWGRPIDVFLRRVVASSPSGSAWWTPPARLSSHESEVLARACTLAVVAGFIGGLVSQTIAFAAKDFGVDSAAQSTALAVIRIGALVTLVSLAAADRWGRKRLIRLTLAGAALMSFLTAFAPTLSMLTVTQLGARGFVAAGALLIAVVCAEEMPAAARAFGIGVTALSGGLGVGMVLWFLPLVDLDPGAWRLLFLVAAPAGVIAMITVSRLPETRRFEEMVSHHAPRSHLSGRRLAVVGLIFLLLNVFAGPTSQLQNDYLTTVRGLSGSGVTAFLLLTNTWGGLGVWAGSRLSDRVSRRFTALIGLTGFAVGNAIMFSSDGAAMWVGSLLGSIVGAAIVPSLGALQPELFPTGRRGLSSGWTNIAAVAGSVAGFVVAARLIDVDSGADYATTTRLLAIAPLLAAALLFWIPETAGESLESINPEDRT